MQLKENSTFAQAEILPDKNDFPPLVPEGGSEPTAFPVLDTAVNNLNLTAAETETSSVVYNADERDPSSRIHKKHHKRNVLTGTLSGVVIGLILLGPIGAIAGGFGGNAIVRARERRYCRMHGMESGAAGCVPKGAKARTGVVS